ncbi:MAG: O-antigen ligase family protein [Microbacterium sp.]|uniref:O-antigen ligase family protein n=1 Tax=Microbacterium sp. TaxID=51671 RepID=UPI003D6EF27C
MGSAIRFGDAARVAAFAAGAAVIALTFLVALQKLGAAVLPLLVLAVAAVIVVQHPGWTLALVVVPVLVLEGAFEGGVFPNVSAFYDQSRVLSPLELAIVLLIIATVLDVARRHEFRMPDPLTLPLLLVAAAIASGVVTGLFNGGSLKETSFALRPLIVLLLMPIVVVNVVRGRTAIRRALLVAAILAAVKAATGVIAVVIGEGLIDPSLSPLAYLEPTPNWLTMTFLLVVVAALVARMRPPLWAIAIAALAVASLLLSYRRSFWIAAIVGILIVALVGAGRLRWRVAVPSLAIVGFAAWLTLATGMVADVEGPIAQRAQDLNPTRIEANPQDRYRLDERRNVVRELEDHPITGLGLTIPWTGRYPPAVDRVGSRDYAHINALWWWLKLGILGLVAYISLIATGIWVAYRVWHEQPDPWLKVVGLGVLGGMIGLVVVETAISATGVTERFSVTIGAALGLLAAMLADARRKPTEATPEVASRGPL